MAAPATPQDSGTFEDGVFRVAATPVKPPVGIVPRDSIWMRDPFVLVLKHPESEYRRFYLYGTTDKPPPGSKNAFGAHPATGFNCYTSEDLESWNGPIQVFQRPENFWADTQFWAPEVHPIGRKYYMLASFRNSARGTKRGIQVLVSDSPDGQFKPVASVPLSPPGWDCLDGTLCWEWSEEQSTYILFMVFCREFTQVGDGQVCAVQVSLDLKTALGEPFVLFSASAAPWVEPVSGRNGFEECFVTDGPFMYYSRSTGELLMLWSSIGPGRKYCVGISRSSSGKLAGPWVHDPKPLFEWDGGHCMFFEGLKGQLTMALHLPNRSVFGSRPWFLPIEESCDEQNYTILKVREDALARLPTSNADGLNNAGENSEETEQ